MLPDRPTNLIGFADPPTSEKRASGIAAMGPKITRYIIATYYQSVDVSTLDSTKIPHELDNISIILETHTRDVGVFRAYVESRGPT